MSLILSEPLHEITLVHLDQLTNMPTADQLRGTKQDWDALASSIEQDGLHQPITVRPVDDGYRIVAGRHRAYAHQLLGSGEIQAIVREDLDDAKEAIITAVENLQRTDLTAYDEAQAFQAIMDTGLNQGDTAKRAGVSQGQVSKRIKLLQVPPAIARHAGDRLPVEEALLFAPLADCEELLAEVAKIAKEQLGNGGRPTAAEIVLGLARHESRVVCTPFGYSWFRMHSVNDWAESNWIESNKAYKTTIKALPHVTLQSKTYNGQMHGQSFCLDVPGATEALVAARERYAAKPKSKKETTAGGKTAAQKLEERTERLRSQIQMQAVEQHLLKQESFGDDLVRVAYKRFLLSVGQVAARKVEQKMLHRILAEYAPKDHQDLARGQAKIVDQLWDENRLVVDRYVAAVAYLSGTSWTRAHTIEKRDDDILRATAGKSWAQLENLVKKELAK